MHKRAAQRNLGMAALVIRFGSRPDGTYLGRSDLKNARDQCGVLGTNGTANVL
jgi:hypothetical protein